MTSRVLKQWLQERPGGAVLAAQRAGLMPGNVVPLPQRMLHGHRRSYAAAQVNRLTEGWSTSTLSANADIHASLDNLRARSRQLARDNDYARKFLQLVGTNVVGSGGFQFQARIYDPAKKPDTGANDAVERAWTRWSGREGVRAMCDVTGRNSLRSFCRAVILAAARDGEFLVRIVRGASARNPFGIALQLLDIDRLDTALNRAAEGAYGAIRMGVEVDEFGGPVAYWLRSRHPGETYAAASDVRDSRHIRLLAADVIHDFIGDRPEQYRGVPWMHASMLRINNLGGYEEAAVVAARVGASKMGFFTTENGNAETLSDEADADTGDLYTDAEAGTFGTLPPGAGFVPFNPDYPSAMFGDFVKANLRGIASGLGVAYHALANDLEGVNFSSIRSGTLEERDQWMMIQEWFIEAFLEPVFAEWIGSALAFGQVKLDNGSTLPLAKREKFAGHLFTGRRWEWVDPLRDIQADIAAVDANLQSPQRVAAKLGRDYEDLLIELKAAQEMRDRIGITPEPAKPAKSSKPKKPGEDGAVAEDTTTT